MPLKEKGRGGPFFFFLDLLPRWEKGFPSGPWPPWHGRGESPSEIGYVYLFLSVSAFSSAALSPFRIYMEICNSDWTETFAVNFLPKISFIAAEEGHQPPYGWPTRVRGAPRGAGAPPASWPPRAPSRMDFSSQKSYIFQKNLRQFLSRLDSV